MYRYILGYICVVWGNILTIGLETTKGVKTVKWMLNVHELK